MSDPLIVEAQLAARDKEIKQLTAELKRWQQYTDDAETKAERLQAKVAALEGALLKCTMNHDEAHYIAQTALDTIAATEQEHNESCPVYRECTGECTCSTDQETP